MWKLDLSRLILWRRPVTIDDGWLVSFPKSGRTWMRVVLADLGIEIPVTHDGSDYKNPVHFAELLPCGESYRMKKVIFLVRDPRDVVVSYYFELTRRQKVYAGEIGDFIKDPRYGLERIIYFNMAWFRQSVCSDFLLLTYESIHETPQRVFEVATKFLGYRRSARLLKKAVDNASFAALQKLELSGALSGKFGKALLPGDVDDPESYKVRRGMVRGYTSYLTPEQVDWCNLAIKKSGYHKSLINALSCYGIDSQRG